MNNLMDTSSQMQLVYAADEKPPHLLSAFLGFQSVLLIISSIALTPVVVLRIAGQAGPQNAWVIFAALTISGLTTCLQASRLGRWGSGYPLYMGTSGAFIAVGAAAVARGGLPLLGTLAAASALVQLTLASRLAWFRHVITPSVGGVIVMLIVVTVFPIGTDLLNKVPPDAQGIPAAVTAAMTFGAIVAIAVFGSNRWRLWGPLIGVIIGCSTAAPFGLLDWSRVWQVPWFGLPSTGWPGLDLSFGVPFWSLFPAFTIVTVVGAIETFGDAVSMQRAAYRQYRPIDFRSVQGALRADGIGNLLSGLMGTLPNTTYSNSISIVEFTGVSAPRAALYGGGFLVVLAFFPKVSAVLRAIPNPVVGAYMIILFAILFAAGGIRLLAHGGLSQENVLLVGLSFWMGYAFQERLIFPQLMPAWLHTLLDNGMTAGGVTALILSGLFSLRQRRPDTLQVLARTQAVHDIHHFLEARGSRVGWDTAAIRRLQLVAEEALLFLIGDDGVAGKPLRINLRFTEDKALLEFVSGANAADLESIVQSLTNVPGEESEIGLRLLRSMSTSVTHHHFDDGNYLALELDSRPL